MPVTRREGKIIKGQREWVPLIGEITTRQVIDILEKYRRMECLRHGENPGKATGMQATPWDPYGFRSTPPQAESTRDYGLIPDWRTIPEEQLPAMAAEWSHKTRPKGTPRPRKGPLPAKGTPERAEHERRRIERSRDNRRERRRKLKDS